ncbi:bifunctional 3'-5' exonuclease/DNA polymerase [Galbitalea soli]|uniref:DNA-directed DNA polymerase n=1 Tax=Galbitalea soli TaxID=1268042 RepID=A0A7C9PLN3_9MICO|nr:bifunctional 3'-5' exonuclease/DNA polymerase [Galbitalea soli]NYJ31033.1 DNA polymerase-1 [Galbitalea soli]
MDVVVAEHPDGVRLTPVSGAPDLAEAPPFSTIPRAEFPAEVARRQAEQPVRWVWSDTDRWYPALLAALVRVERCVDLRLSHAILRSSELTTGSALATLPAGYWDAPPPPVRAADGALFELDDSRNARPSEADVDPVAEWSLQRLAVAGSAEPGRIARLLAAESAGSLIAAEMQYAGLPWRADVHRELLDHLLGPRPVADERPARLQSLLDEMRRLIDVPDLNPDSPAELLKGLARGGVLAPSTRSWDLRKIPHPVIAPLLEYKKLSRLASANGWHWLETWVHDGRFRPDYVVGGVVTGRWATSGGGALQLPKQIRRAVVADPGWKLIVADAAQLEPRILAAMAGDRDMIEAGSAGDLYAGIVASGAIDTREHAKVALLGAMYGATQGEGGRLMPQLAKAYPRAIALVESAARRGERGEVVSTRLGRSSPRPGEDWRLAQAEAYGEASSEASQSRARGQARGWGRFTRNFIVQGTAAEWALCWMGSLRGRLARLGTPKWITEQPHLVFFLHDEVVVHAPAELADAVAAEVVEAAAEAGRLLFGGLPIEFPLTVAIVDDYGSAK